MADPNPAGRGGAARRGRLRHATDRGAQAARAGLAARARLAGVPGVPGLPGLAALAALAALAVAAPLAAQGGPSAGPADFLAPPIDSEQPYVVIRLAENTLSLVQGARVLWSAPVATGTGFRLEGAGQSWDFDTPRGVFRVQRKEKDPVWIMPDWAFIERGERVPPADSPRRRRKGVLGSTAIYIGYELAIHGTDRPELVLNPDPEARRVSHGCIRMTDEDARRLFHEVDVGTLVLIY